MAILSFGNDAASLIGVHDPQELSVSLQDIDAAGVGRNADGSMTRDRVVGGAAAKRKIEVKWPPLTPADMSAILQAIEAVFFYVRYPDPYTGQDRIGYFYAGDRHAPVYRVQNGVPLWESLSVNFIEQ